MNILMITDNDPAGMGIAFTKAINRYTDHSCRLITTATRYNFNFEKDIHIPDLDKDGFDEVEELLKRADIFHFHILKDENSYIGPFYVKDYINGKKIVHHHHGHPDFRTNPLKYFEKYKRLGRKVLVSTPDLLTFMPDAVWQPNLVPVNDPLYMPSDINGNGIITICQSPTRKELKNTVEFNDTVDALQKRFSYLRSVVIENTLHRECLKMKRKCDIHFDHMQGYYGVSSLEGLSQGKPVIAGLDDRNLCAIKDFTGARRLPWIIAKGREDLKMNLESLVLDRDFMKETGERSREFMERYWTEEMVIHRLNGFYSRL